MLDFLGRKETVQIEIKLCLQFLSSSSQSLVLKISQAVDIIRKALTPKYRDKTKFKVPLGPEFWYSMFLHFRT